MKVKVVVLTGIVFATAVALSACAGRKHAEQSMTAGPSIDPLSLDFEHTFTRVANAPYHSASHAMGQVYVMPWVNGVGLDAYKQQGSSLPVGTVIVKEHFPIVDGTPTEARAAYLVMAKMQPGYDAKHGDWYYAVVDDMAHQVKMQGKVEMCIGCHTQAARTDYVFGVPEGMRAY